MNDGGRVYPERGRRDETSISFVCRPDYVDQARTFADEPADRLGSHAQKSVASEEVALHGAAPNDLSELGH
jgi:hypothetical protein